MGSYGESVNLNQYRRLEGKWQFLPAVKRHGKLNRKLILNDGEPVSLKEGVFSLDRRQLTATGQRVFQLLADGRHCSPTRGHRDEGTQGGSVGRIALYAASERAPNFTRVRRSDSTHSRFATASSSALFGMGAAVG